MSEGIKSLLLASNQLSRKFLNSSSAANTLTSQKTQFISEIFEASRYLSAKDEVLSFLHDLQKTVQEKEIISIESLLTSLINEIIPSNDDKVKMTTKVENNRIHLDVDIISNGKVRNVFEDKGGSIHNILSLGLRFITLNKSINRRFIILDEADTGIKKDYMHSFSKVMHELSIKTNTQVIYISHHPHDYFKDYARVIELSSKSNTIYSDLISDIDCSSVTPDYFKSIRLMNFRQHKNTLIELSPFVNVIIGDNDIGKSTIIEALTSILENKALKSSIRDDCNEQQVELVDAEDQMYTWRHNNKKSKRTYSLHDSDGTLIQESFISKGTPEWLDDFLMMPMVADVNLHTVKQFKSHFIIGDEFSGTKKAELLSFGKEVKELNKMLSAHTSKVKNYQETIRTRQSDVNALNKQIQLHTPILSYEVDIKAIEERVLQVQDSINQVSSLTKSIDDIRSVLSKSMKGSEVKHIATTLNEPVHMSSMYRVIEGWKHNLTVLNESELFKKLNLVNAIYIDNGVISLEQNLQMINKSRSKNKQPEIKVIPTQESNSGSLTHLCGLINKGEEAKNNALNLRSTLNSTRNQKIALESELGALKLKLPSTCPTCNQVTFHDEK